MLSRPTFHFFPTPMPPPPTKNNWRSTIANTIKSRRRSLLVQRTIAAWKLLSWVRQSHNVLLPSVDRSSERSVNYVWRVPLITKAPVAALYCLCGQSVSGMRSAAFACLVTWSVAARPAASYHSTWPETETSGPVSYTHLTLPTNREV